MRRTDAERLIAAHLKDIYGFALKRCASLQDAEDLSQEIACRVFGMLLTKEDLRSPEPYIWTAAHHALANYYRSRARASVGIPLDELTDLLPSPRDTAEEVAEQETLDRLHREIARLSRLQRRIVIAYYFENKKQDAIAQELEIPAGTVKWHLFEAKKELI